jgi:transcription-repair coupling factor (superfamily II helicase)
MGKSEEKAAQQIRDTAAELLNLYARRAARHGHAFEYSAKDYEAFAESFGLMKHRIRPPQLLR